MVGWETPQSRLVQQLRREHVAGERVLAALARVPRDMFVDEELRPRAFDDTPLPIGLDQTIAQPSAVALMTEALEVGPAQTVLEVGTGSGYHAAVLAELARGVITLERLPALAARAGRVLAHLGYANVRVIAADGTLGWPAAAPYARILVTAAAPAIPEPLIEQLAPGGRLVMPLGGRTEQQLVVLSRDEHGGLGEQSLGPVRFVPLAGLGGW